MAKNATKKITKKPPRLVQRVDDFRRDLLRDLRSAATADRWFDEQYVLRCLDGIRNEAARVQGVQYDGG